MIDIDNTYGVVEYLRGKTTFIIMYKNGDTAEFHEKNFSELGKKLDLINTNGEIMSVTVIKYRDKNWDPKNDPEFKDWYRDDTDR